MENYISKISANEKKEFIRWFLTKHTMKRRESVWILNWIISNESVLNNIIFVDEVHKYDRGILISTTASESISFRFFKGSQMSVDPEKAFHDLRIHPEDKFYIQLDFPNKHQENMYLTVLEGYNSSTEISPAIIEMVDEFVIELEKKNIMNEIDAALDKGDEKMFVELCEMLNRVGQKKTLSFSGWLVDK